MDVASIAASQNAQQTSAFSQLTDNFDTFLTLLTTQLRNQDPLDPLDTEKFTSQLVQFASVEQSIQTNQHLETLIGLQAAADRSGALSLLGRSVMVESDMAHTDGRGAQWAYSLPDGAAAVKLSIVNSTGKAVASFTGDNRVGEHEFAWDGMMADGKPAPEGAYRLIVEAVDATGAPAAFNTQTLVNVSGVSFGEDGPMIETPLGAVSLDAVERVIAKTQEG
ncbi:MAG: flagellar hook capping FlgD N-terminal domain-containing protein [Parvularculaceae bacterium]